MTKDKKTHPDRMETKKYCRFCKTYAAQRNEVIRISKGREVMEENTVNTVETTEKKAAKADQKTAKKKRKKSFFKGLKTEYKKIVFADKGNCC